MKRKSKYNITAEWDDPFDRQGDRRKKERCVENFKIKIGLRVPGHEKLLAGTGIVQNISQNGMLCRTKHKLSVGQEVHLSISTREYSQEKNFPIKFIGTARVSRLEPIDAGISEVALIFGTDLSEDMSFAIFIEALQSIASFKATLQ